MVGTATYKYFGKEIPVIIDKIYTLFRLEKALIHTADGSKPFDFTYGHTYAATDVYLEWLSDVKLTDPHARSVPEIRTA